MEVSVERIKHIVQINIVLGIWLVIAPFVMGYSGSTVELATDIAVGAWLICCSWWILAADSGHVAAAALSLLGGVWLLATPFALHYPRLSRPFDNDIAVGVLAVLVSAAATWMLSSRQRTTA
jgi:hypothetical protein